MAQLRLPHPSHYRKTFRATSGGEYEANKTESGIWQCCHCKNESEFYLRSGKHPVGSIRCTCTHKPCEHCHFTGPLKHFVPIQEPFTIVTPNSEKGEEIPYGIICKKCGSGWRATPTLRHQKTSAQELKKKHCPQQFFSLPAMPDRVRKGHRSMLDFAQSYNTSQGGSNGNRIEDTAIRSTDIQFSGLKCTCGSVSRVEITFCFRIVKGNNSDLEDERRAQSSYHDKPIISIRGVEHPNPLRSNPV